jgi:hypothetical protein
MKTIKLSRSARVRNILYKNPNLQAKEIAEKAKCDIGLVYTVKSAMKKASTLTDLAYNVSKGRSKLSQLVDSLPMQKPKLPIRMMHPIDMVNSPPHYTVGGIETIDFIKAKLSADEYRGYLMGNCIKYSSRLGHKLGSVDAGKLAWYANKLEGV